jgi:hypothetical protein
LPRLKPPDLFPQSLSCTFFVTPYAYPDRRSSFILSKFDPGDFAVSGFPEKREFGSCWKALPGVFLQKELEELENSC